MAKAAWRHFATGLSAAALALFLSASPAWPESAALPADPSGERSFFSVQWENDRLASDNDRHYTNGIRFSWDFPRGKELKSLEWLTRLSMLDHVESHEYGLAFGQSMFTPDDIEETALIPDDRPYAGWLYAEGHATVRNESIADTVLVSVGVIGPASLAGEVQRFVHDISGVTEPEGWANQLRNEPALLLAYQRNWQAPLLVENRRIKIDVMPKLGIALGNVFTHAATGATLRIGTALPAQGEPIRIQPTLAGGGRFVPRPGKVDWQLFMGGEGRAVARNIFLDGNTFRESHSVAKNHFVADLYAGVAATFGTVKRPFALSYTFVWRSKEFDLQQQANIYASIQLRIGF